MAHVRARLLAGFYVCSAHLILELQNACCLAYADDFLLLIEGQTREIISVLEHHQHFGVRVTVKKMVQMLLKRRKYVVTSPKENGGEILGERLSFSSHIATKSTLWLWRMASKEFKEMNDV